MISHSLLPIKSVQLHLTVTQYLTYTHHIATTNLGNQDEEMSGLSDYYPSYYSNALVQQRATSSGTRFYSVCQLQASFVSNQLANQKN